MPAISLCADADGRAGRQTAEHEDRMRRPGQLLRISLQRRPDVDLGLQAAVGEPARVRRGRQDLEHAEVGAVRHDPHDHGGSIVEPERLSDGRRVAAERALPQRLADEGHRGAARAVFIRR